MKPRFLLTVTLTLINVAIVSLVWIQGLAASAAAYSSPLASALPRGAATAGLTRQLVIVVAEGLTANVLRQMPFTSAMRTTASAGALTLGPNASSLDILTGAHPDWRQGGRKPETLIDAASRSANTIIVAGPADWARAASPGATEIFVPDPQADDPSGQVLRYALRRLDFWLPELALIVLPRPAGAVDNDLLLANALDASVPAIWRMMQDRMPGNTTLLLVGDSDGAPLIAVGCGVTFSPWVHYIPGDVALTAAALTGAPLPSGAEGAVAYQWLLLAEPVRAELMLAAAAQRQALADAYLTGIGKEPTGEDVESDLVVARAALNGRIYDSVTRLAGHALAVADAEMAAGRRERLAAERWARTPAVLAAAVPLVIYLFSLAAAVLSLSAIAKAIGLVPRLVVRSWRSATLAGTAAALAAWYTFQHYAATEPRWPLLLWTLAGGSAAAYVICMFLHWLQRRRTGVPRYAGVREPGPPVEVAVASFALTSVFLTAMPLAWLFYLNGPLVSWYLPDPRGIAVLNLHLWQTLACALTLLATPWLAALLHGLGRLTLAVSERLWELVHR